MAKDQPLFVKDAVFKLQMSLLEGIRSEDQLFAAGSLISRRDYEDVVTERSITNVCGYPLCRNALPSVRPRKGKYRISLKEHKVYDLHETYMFCSSACVVNSKAFAGILQDERCPTVDPTKLDNVLRLFENLNVEPVEDLGKGGDLGLSGLRIQEKTETSTGEVSLEQWVGPSNAIEGYVPKQRDDDSKSSKKNIKKGSKASHGSLNDDKNLIYGEMDFMSTIITQDEYTVSKVSSDQTDATADHQIKPAAKVKVPKKSVKKVVSKDDDSIQDLSSSFKSSLNLSTSEKEKEIPKSHEAVIKSSVNPSVEKKAVHSVTISEIQCDVEPNTSERKSMQIQGETSRVAGNDNANTSSLYPANVEGKLQIEKATGSCKTKPKSSLKSAGNKKLSRSVTWADEKINSSVSNDLCSVREFGDGDIKRDSGLEGNMDIAAASDEEMLRRASAEACAIALSQASEAVASGDSDIPDAVSEAGIIILPSSHDVIEEGTMEDIDITETDAVTLRKPGIPNFDLFDSEESWYDSPPEGFSLNLSPFASMWDAFFSWITSSSLAYIYGRDASFHEEFLSVNGIEYPSKIILADGRSSEIKQTLASCLARSLPAVVAELRLPIPVSTLEQGMVCLLDTMSLVDALPAFRMKQWQVVVLLLIDALSVCRIPALIPYMMDRRDLFHKVLNGSQLGMEQYELLKDLIMPLGRAPHFSAKGGA